MQVVERLELRLTFQHQRTHTIVCISLDFYLPGRSFIAATEKHKTGLFWGTERIFFFFLSFLYKITTQSVPIRAFYG